MTEEFSQKSDGSVKLVVVFEGAQAPTIPLKNVEYILLCHPDHQSFIRKFGSLYEARGFRMNFLENKEIQLAYDYRFDAVRFSFKIFSILQAIDELTPTDHFAWIDADVRCIKHFGVDDLLKFFPDENNLMSYLGRNFPLVDPYSECGFLGFNSKHPLVRDFLNSMGNIYSSGEIFSHHQWHDSWIWDQVRLEFQSRNVLFKNISGLAFETHHPFINCDLGLFFDHLKGPQRKQMGKSFAEDYKLSPR
jgi:hypothetical protein